MSTQTGGNALVLVYLPATGQANPIEKWKTLPGARKKQIRRQYELFLRLPVRQQRTVREGYRKFRFLPIEQRKRLRERWKKRRQNRRDRRGNEITLRGVTFERSNGTVSFNNTVTLLVGDSTTVSRQASPEASTILDISVGQRLIVVGTLRTAKTGESSIDASTGSVRMLLARLRGSVTDVSDDLVLDLSGIDNRSPSLFDFDGTGVAAGFDADPAAYEVDYTTLSIDQLANGSAVKIAGHVSSFGEAPADFSAQTIADVSFLPAVMRVNWTEANTLATDTGAGDSLKLDLGNTGCFHHVSQSGVKIDLLGDDNPPVVQFDDETRLYSIKTSAERMAFTDMNTFIATLETLVAEGQTVVDLVAPGEYTADRNSLRAT